MTFLPTTGGVGLNLAAADPDGAADAGMAGREAALRATEAVGAEPGSPLGFEHAGMSPTSKGRPRAARRTVREGGCAVTPPYVSHFPRSALANVKSL